MSLSRVPVHTLYITQAEVQVLVVFRDHEQGFLTDVQVLQGYRKALVFGASIFTSSMTTMAFSLAL